MANNKKPKLQKNQDRQPGKEHVMDPKPRYEASWYKGSGKLKDKVAIITGGDSGIGRAVSVLFAREGAKVAIVYLNEDKDAKKTRSLVQKEGSEALLLKGDISDYKFCEKAASETMNHLGKINILVNNAAEQHPDKKIEDISVKQFEETFKTNIFSYFYMSKVVIPHLVEGDTIINTTSVTAYRGSTHLVDYSATKGAIVAYTRSLSQQLAGRGIRVNGVAPGPVWTPLIPSTFPAKAVAKFGKDTPMGRAGQPEEIAPSYVFLASKDSTYFTGQVLHPNGGDFVST